MRRILAIAKREPISTLIAPAIWSLVSFVPLVGFYAHYFAMSSRYIVDFGPAIVAAIVGVLAVLVEIVHARTHRQLSALEYMQFH